LCITHCHVVQSQWWLNLKKLSPIWQQVSLELISEVYA
jgi:hypothetical protein